MKDINLSWFLNLRWYYFVPYNGSPRVFVLSFRSLLDNLCMTGHWKHNLHSFQGCQSHYRTDLSSTNYDCQETEHYWRKPVSKIFSSFFTFFRSSFIFSIFEVEKKLRDELVRRWIFCIFSLSSYFVCGRAIESKMRMSVQTIVLSAATSLLTATMK